MEMGAQTKPIRPSVAIESIIFAADLEDEPAVWQLCWDTELTVTSTIVPPSTPAQSRIPRAHRGGPTQAGVP